MESSRSSPLTTFIMTLPMIVVPAIAMLKPADNGKSLLSGLVQAASDHAGQTDPGELDDLSAVGDDFDSMFGELESDAPAFSDELTDFSELDDMGSPSAPAFPSDPQLGTANPFESYDQSGHPEDASSLIARLKQMGARRTLWFTPGSGETGFVAFFPGPQGQVSYRFEGIASNRTAAVQQVIEQAEAWLRR